MMKIVCRELSVFRKKGPSLWGVVVVGQAYLEDGALVRIVDGED